MKNSLPDDIDFLKNIIAEQDLKIKSKDSKIKSQNVEINILREQISFFKTLKFGPRSEKVAQDQLLLFNEL